jgi:hypothetical protein
MFSYFSIENFLLRHGLQLIDIGGPSETEGLSPSMIENSQISTVVNRTLRLDVSSSGETTIDSSFLVLGAEEIFSEEIAMVTSQNKAIPGQRANQPAGAFRETRLCATFSSV